MRTSPEEFVQDVHTEPISGEFPTSRPPQPQNIPTVPSGPGRGKAKAESLAEMVEDIHRYHGDYPERLEKIEELERDLKLMRDFFERVPNLAKIVQSRFTLSQEFFRQNPIPEQELKEIPDGEQLEHLMEESYQSELANDYYLIANLAKSAVLMRSGVFVPEHLRQISFEKMDKGSMEMLAKDLYRTILFQADKLFADVENFSRRVSSVADFGMYGAFLKILDRSLLDTASQALDARAYEEAVTGAGMKYHGLSGVGINPIDQDVVRNKQLNQREKSRSTLLNAASYFFIGIREYILTLIEVLDVQKEKIKKGS